MNNVKRFNISILILITVILVAACSNDTENASTEKDNNQEEIFEMDVNVTFPSTHYITERAFEPFKEYVEEETDGRVIVNVHSGEALGKINSVYQDINNGLYDLSLLIIPYFEDTEFFPYTIGNLPFALEGPEEASVILEKFGEKYLETTNDYIVFGGAASSNGYDLYSTQPVKGIDDLKNFNIRSSGKADTVVIKEIGATPVSFSLTEVYEGLEKHTIDATFNDPTGGVSSKFHEPANHITKLGFQVMPAVGIMNKGFYEKLPSDLQEQFDGEFSDKFLELLVDAYLSAQSEAYEFLEENANVGTWSDEEYDRLKDTSKLAWDLWIKQANENGYPGEEMVDYFLELIDEEGYDRPYN